MGAVDHSRSEMGATGKGKVVNLSVASAWVLLLVLLGLGSGFLYLQPSAVPTLKDFLGDELKDMASPLNTAPGFERVDYDGSQEAWDKRVGEVVEEVDPNKMATVGDCEFYFNSTDKKYVFIQSYGEQTFSALAGVANGIRAAAGSGRAHVGPFMSRGANMQSSLSDLRRNHGPFRSGQAPDFAGTYMNMTFLDRIPNACLITSPLVPSDVCGNSSIKVCAGGACHAGEKGVWMEKDGEFIDFDDFNDLADILKNNKVVRDTKCLVFERLNKGVKDTSSEPNSPGNTLHDCVTHSVFGSAQRDHICSGSFATSMLFEVSPTAQKVAADFLEKSGFEPNEYLGVHLRSEKLRAGTCMHNQCDCRGKSIVRACKIAFPEIYEHLKISPNNTNIYVAADVARSISFQADAKTPEEHDEFYAALAEEFPDHILYNTDDRSLSAFVDATNLAMASHCVSFGGGNLAKTASYMRVRMGKKPCLVFSKLTKIENSEACRIDPEYFFREIGGKTYGMSRGNLAWEGYGCGTP